MKVFCEHVDLICCKEYKGKTYGKVYENGKLYDFVSDGVIEDVKDVDAVFEFRYGTSKENGNVWTQLKLREMKKN